MKQRKSNILLVLILIAGLSLLLYPPVSNWWNSYRQSKVVASYADSVSRLNDEEYQQILDAAKAYNESTAVLGGPGVKMTPEQEEEYKKQLDIDGSGVMGYVEIPKIRCTLPVYHGIDDAVLQVAIGHLPGTSLPVGGKGTHCVISGHRGLPSAKLFTDLDKLEEGDTFNICVLNEVLTYEVDQIHIVLPQETRDLRIEEDKDLCTLVTCTPYGVNTHRLLVRGHRIKTQPGILALPAEAIQIRPVVIMPVIAAPMLVLLVILVLARSRRKSPQAILYDHRRKRNESA